MPEPHLRAADADREVVAGQLGAAMSAGRLTVEEFDDRLTRVHAARTYGELAELTTDLPPAAAPSTVPPPVAQPSGRACAGWGHGSSLRAAWGSWLTTAVLVVGIWLVTSVAAGQLLYPWPVWVVGPWGVVLLAQGVGARRDRLPG
jgi:hypothetical protein